MFYFGVVGKWRSLWLKLWTKAAQTEVAISELLTLPLTLDITVAESFHVVLPSVLICRQHPFSSFPFACCVGIQHGQALMSGMFLICAAVPWFYLRLLGIANKQTVNKNYSRECNNKQSGDPTCLFAFWEAPGLPQETPVKKTLLSEYTHAFLLPVTDVYIFFSFPCRVEQSKTLLQIKAGCVWKRCWAWASSGFCAYLCSFEATC